MRIQDYTKAELQALSEACNFTTDEMRYFELKSKGASDVQVSFDLCISTATVTRIGRKVKTKINRCF